MKERETKKVLLLGDAGSVFDSLGERLSACGYDISRMTRGEFIDFFYSEDRPALSMDRFHCIACSVLLDPHSRDISDMGGEEWEEFKRDGMNFLYDVNRAFVPGLLADGGKFVVLGSIAGLTPMRGEGVNGAASAAAFMMVKSMAIELAARGVCVMGAALGSIEAESVKGLPEASGVLRKHLAAETPASVEQVVGAVEYIIENGANAGTGSILQLDSGLSCSYMREW